MDIKLPGLNTSNINFHVPGGDVHITGKWFNYGIIFIVMILDLNMWKNQIFYYPFYYGQYVDSAGYIATVSDRDWLANATEDTLNYVWRWNNTNPLTNRTFGSDDHKMNSRFYGYSLDIKGIAFIPSLCMFIFFGYLVKRFSKDEKPSQLKRGETTDQSRSSGDDIRRVNQTRKLNQIGPYDIKQESATQQQHNSTSTLTRDLQQSNPLHKLNSSAKDIRDSFESLSCSLNDKDIPEPERVIKCNDKESSYSSLMFSLPEAVSRVDGRSASPTNQNAKEDEDDVKRTGNMFKETHSPSLNGDSMISLNSDTAGVFSSGTQNFESCEEISSSLNASRLELKESLKHWRDLRSKLLSVQNEQKNETMPNP